MASRNEWEEVRSSEEEIILNHRLGHLYSHDFGDGPFFQAVFEDPNEVRFKIAPRTMIKVIYLKEGDCIDGLEIIKLVSDKETQRVKLNKFNLSQIKEFLSFISLLDLKSITERRLKLIDEDELDEETVKRVKTILSKEGGDKVIQSLLEEGIITSADITNTAYRKKQLSVFEKMLAMSDYWKTYAKEVQINDSKEEKVWQHFFAANEWIFGYGLDYRFNGILQQEFHASDTQADGSEAVVTDYLLGDKRFTTFVEIKKPSTPIFGNSKNRSNCWSLANDLIDGVSQILEQKASGQIKLEKRELYDEKGNLIEQKAHDSKVILIIGEWSKMTFASEQEKATKEKTFELYRRDSRNIKILTFDELYDRAKFIVEHKVS